MAMSRQHMTSSAGVVGLVLLAAVAASPALAARRDIGQQFGNYAPGYMPRQMQQQWQMGVNRPPSALKQDPSGLPPAAPGHVWVQVPITEKPPKPDAVAPAGPAAVGPVDVPASAEQVAPTVDPEMLEMLKNCQEPRGQFAHPSHCAKFFNCWDGYVAEQSCPGGLVFSDQGPFCDYVKNVDCSARGGEPPAPTQPAQQQPGSGEMSEATTVSPVAGGSEGESGEGGSQICDDEKLKEDVGEGCKEKYSRYRSPKNCNVFIVCANNVPHRFECPETLNYNESLGVCDYPYRVDCGNSTSAYPNEVPIAAEGAQQQPGAEGAKVPDEVWRHFYQEQFRLPANAASASTYYGGFSHLPPVQVAPGYNRFG